MSFLRPVRPGRLIGKGRVVQRNGDLAFLEASLLDGDAAVIATATATEWPDGRDAPHAHATRVPSVDVERGFTEGWNEFLDGLVARIQTRPAT
jgi:hypothetical protein